jgi:hypothetical protein
MHFHGEAVAKDFASIPAETGKIERRRSENGTAAGRRRGKGNARQVKTQEKRGACGKGGDKSAAAKGQAGEHERSKAKNGDARAMREARRLCGVLNKIGKAISPHGSLKRATFAPLGRSEGGAWMRGRCEGDARIQAALRSFEQNRKADPAKNPAENPKEKLRPLREFMNKVQRLRRFEVHLAIRRQ